jgi:hypothetical protein
MCHDGVCQPLVDHYVIAWGVERKLCVYPSLFEWYSGIFWKCIMLSLDCSSERKHKEKYLGMDVSDLIAITMFLQA